MTELIDYSLPEQQVFTGISPNGYISRFKPKSRADLQNWVLSYSLYIQTGLFSKSYGQARLNDGTELPFPKLRIGETQFLTKRRVQTVFLN